MTKDSKSSQPKEAEVMSTILKEMGVTNYEPGVINQMLEFTYRYVSQILDESRSYANYAKKSKPIDSDDVKLAIHMQVEKTLTTPPPRDLLLELSRTRNANPLPAIKTQCGVRLPPDRYCLSACNMQIKSSKKGSGSKGGSSAIKPSISMVTTKTGNNQTVTLVQKASNAVSAAPPQKLVSVNRPLIKVTPGLTGGSSSPKIQINPTTNMSGLKIGTIKTEDQPSQKRKRDDDEDYDAC
ncbi:UNVERIFIED_CONTAM: hypothetical protein RMT77_018338 [Armadillidium vulgare]|nr:Transcription initiation factor TFIID subunit 9 [Armadillidium vulgare]